MSLTDLVILLGSIDGPDLGRLDITYYKLGFKVARYSFQGQYLPSLSINCVAINKDLEKLPPRLY